MATNLDLGLDWQKDSNSVRHLVTNLEIYSHSVKLTEKGKPKENVMAI